MTDHIRHEPSDVPRRRNMRRTMKWVAGLAVGVPVGLLSVAVIGVLVAANTTPGQRYIERQADSLTGGMVHLEGFGGTFPTALHIRHLEVRDAKGAWLELDRLALRWSPLSLIHMSVNVQALTADRLAIHRTPVSASQPTEPSAPSKPSSLHLRIDVARVHVGRIEVGKDIAGVPAVFALDGHLGLRDLAPVLNGIQIDHLPRSDVALDLLRLDGPGRLALDFSSPRGAIGVHLVAQDGVGGFISTVGHQPLFDPADLHLDLHGPLSSAKLDFGTQSGSVTASIGGQLDLLKNRGDLVIRAHAPAIAPQPGVAWNSLDVNAALHGDLKAPSGQGTLDLDQLAAAGAGVGHLHATFDGAEGKGAKASLLHLHLTADGLKATGVPSALLAQAPLVADVTLHPEDASQPVVLTLNHPLAQVSAHADLKPAPHGVMDVVLPDLAPLARIGNVDLRGHDVLHASFALPEKSDGPTTLDLTSALAVTGGMKQAADLIGPDGKLKLAVVMTPQGTGADAVRRVELREFTFDGRAVRLHDEGEVDLGKKTIVRNDAILGLTDFRAVSPSLRGHADIGLHAEGPTDDLSAKLHANTVFGMDRVPQGPLTLDAAFQHLPNAPEGTIIASGTLDRAPLALDSKLSRDGQGAYRIDLRTLSWNSVKGEGRLILPAGARVPLGAMNVQIRNLGDFSALAGQTIGGNIRFDVGTTQPDPARAPTVRLSLVGMLRSAMATIGKLDLGGTVVDPVGQPDVNIRLDVAGLNVKGMTGQASATARGKQEALALTIKAALQNVMDAPASLDTAALLNVPAKEVRLDRLMAVAKGETLRLAGPAHVSFGKATGVDRLRLSVAPQGVAPASIDLAGTVKPALNLRATIANITPALARPFAPTLDAAGTISAQAKLGGTLERPTGNASVTARGLKMRNGPAVSLPAASLDATADFAGSSARIAAALNAGSKIGLNVRGTAPTSATGPLALNTTGHIDLSVANAVAGAQGMALGGQVALDVAIGGTASAPRATGRVDLRNASFNHYGQGVRLSEINGSIVASGDSFALQNVQARAGKGTIGLSGTIGAFRPGLPLDIHLTSEKAQPINSDLLTAVIDTDLRVHGQASTRLDVDGKITLPTVTVNIPNSMPASVPQLEVVRPGQKREVNASSLLIGLNISVISPGEFYVRGHGLDAEMKGRLHIGGLSSAPQIDGGFDLRRGFFNLAGINLNFTHGRVAFNGSGVQHKLDPTLDFRADRNVRGTLASLLVTGYASAPKIDFASTPVEPRDQVLAKLLFGTDTASLSTTQLAELAAAVAQLTGASSFDPLGTVRNALGLDRLAVGGGSGVNNGGTSVEAGKNVMKGVYVGAKQATSGSGTQAQVQVDLTKRLKLNTTVGTGGQVNGFTTPENDPGSSVGLSYGFDY